MQFDWNIPPAVLGKIHQGRRRLERNECWAGISGGFRSEMVGDPYKTIGNPYTIVWVPYKFKENSRLGRAGPAAPTLKFP